MPMLWAEDEDAEAESTPSKQLRIAIFLIALCVLVGITVFSPWLVFTQRRLKFSIEDGSILSFNLTNNHLNATFNFVLRSYNPSKKASIYYDKMGAEVSYERNVVANYTIEPFFQPHRNATTLEVKFVAQNVGVSRSVARDLGLEKASGGVGLEVRFKATIRFKLGTWKTKDQKLRISCFPVLVHVSNSSKNFTRTSCGSHFAPTII